MLIQKIANTIFQKTLIQPESLRRLKETLVQLNILPLEPLFFLIDDNTICSVPKPSIAPNVILSGDLKTFIELLRTKNIRRSMDEGLQFEGDPDVLIALQSVFLSSEFDWEGYLSDYTGDSIAHFISLSMSKHLSGIQRKLTGIKHDLQTFMVEQNLTPSSRQIKEFFEQSDVTRAEIDRLEAKLEQLDRLSQENA